MQLVSHAGVHIIIMHTVHVCTVYNQMEPLHARPYVILQRINCVKFNEEATLIISGEYTDRESYFRPNLQIVWILYETLACKLKRGAGPVE